MPPWLTYTLLFACAASFAFGLWLGGDRGRGRFPRWARFAVVMQIGAFVAAYAVLRPGAGDDGLRDVATASAAGKPIFVDLYSNF